MKRKQLLPLIGLILAALTIYLIAINFDGSATTDTDVEDIKELVHDYSTGKVEDQTASITSHELIVTNSDESKLIYDLPEDEFFVSIAPYVETTHPCAIHSLTGCQGEMIEEEFAVYIEDIEGNVIFDSKLKSFENGFIDLWLPRDKKLRVVIEHDGKRVESEISTFEDDNTCITTMQFL
ncbi:CueP family metal-binding protein [Evansella sp. AB-rgal1]|uniref:CueP family metal-binding protein n=1 Tax=Evansella sp. AB-rgal1 TaxID=3242696 RepID=UPI00359CF634